MFLLNDIDEVERFIKQEKQEILFQEYFDECFGVDVRINVVGGDVKASIKRISESDFRSNLSNGGRAEIYDPTKEEKELAILAASALDCKFCGVDILQTKEGPVVCEVNSNPFFINTYNSTGINIAKYILEYLQKNIKN